MSIQNRQALTTGSEFTICNRGRYAGRPIVYVYLGPRKDNFTVKSLKRQFKNYGWLEKVRSGDAPLVFIGEPTLRSDPLHAKYGETIHTIIDVLKPKTVGIESSVPVIPDPDLLNRVHLFTVRLDAKEAVTRTEEDDPGIHAIVRKEFREGADYVFDLSAYKDRYRIEDFSRNFATRKEYVWAYPKGDTRDEVGLSYDHAFQICKMNGWQVCTRFDMLQRESVNEEDEETEE